MRSKEALDSRDGSGNMLWDEDALIERLVASLEFAETLVSQLGAEDEELPAGLTIERLVADTAMLLLAASNVSSYAAVGPRIVRVAGLLVDHARSPRVLRRICAVCLAPGRRPPVTVRGDGAYGGVGRAAMACLQGIDAAWMHQLTRMQPAEQEPLASFLLCIALQRAFAREEFQAMERVLGEGKRLGLTPCPTGLQSAELLARVAQCGLQDAVPVVPARAKERMPELCPV